MEQRRRTNTPKIVQRKRAASPSSTVQEISSEECPWIGPGSSDAPLRVENFITARINHVAKALSRSAARLYLAQFDLTLPESRILSIVAMRGGCTAREIMDEVSMDKALISRAIKKLADKRLISTWTNADDRRTSLLRLTSRGTEIHEDLMPIARQRQEALLATLSYDERRALWSALFKLEAMVQTLGEKDERLD
ncbi:MarR family winged helix-turn-helix transcriptional regulator [Variovorax terrae]|nr:MarR family winged helix-turn-helix transcriptional regulator [Variovorax terrae]